jgi:hypothetical protein
MPELQDPSQSLKDITNLMVEGVREGNNNPERKAIAFRIADSRNDEELISKIKENTQTPEERFELAYAFFTEAFETEDDLETEGISLELVDQKSIDYMVDGLVLGIEERGVTNENLIKRLQNINDILNRSSWAGNPSIMSSEEALGASYLTKMDLRKLYDRLKDSSLDQENEQVLGIYRLIENLIK